MRLPHPYALEHVLAPTPSLTVFVAEASSGQVVGLLAIDESGPRPLVVGPLVPDDQLAELYGRALLEYALGWARLNGIALVQVKVDLDEERGIGFYLNQGFLALEARQYLLEAHPDKKPPPTEPEGFAFGPCPEMLSSDYLRLYQGIGGPLGWPDRSGWSRPQVFEHLQRPGMHLLAAREGDTFVGFAELEVRGPGEAELIHFGLLEPYRGRGLGGAFLAHVLQQAWDQWKLNRVWAISHSTDHPACLPTYLGYGFAKARAMVFLEKDLESAAQPKADLLAQ
jgi:GNAT superfamily N-acetyltransferase